MANPHDSLSFGEQVQQRLDIAQARVEQEREAMDHVMVDLEENEKRFNEISEQLLREILCPTLETLAAHFDNARLDDTAPQHCVKCQLDRSIRFPAVASVGFQISHSDMIETISINYEAEILPVFFRFERNDVLDLSMEEFDLGLVRQWAEQKALGFLDSYLQIETHEQYQRDNVALDPVCGMRIAKPKGLTYEHDGQLYYFCAQHCLDRFIESPADFVDSPKG